MTTLQAIELFEHKMKNEILHFTNDETLQDDLLKLVDDVSQTMKQTYKAEKSNK